MIGQKLGSFRIEAKVGSGAMGVVYRAVNESSGKTAAVKVIPSSEIGTKGVSYERFKREAEILQQFRHPNIVRFLALGRFQGTSYFAMEFIKGTTLEQLLQERGYLPWQEVVHLGIQMCDALHYAHEHGVVHRDLKPSNLMISEKGEVKLTDFGIAKDLDATALTATGRTVGTAAYMAPEQIRGTPEVSHKTDLYAMGVVLYQMLTGEVAFEGQTAVVMMHRHLNEDPPRPSSKVSDIPVDLDKLVVKLMAKDPAERPWDAAAVGMVLTDLRDKLQRGEPIPMVWPTVGADGTMVGGPARKPRKKKRKKKDEDSGQWIQTASLVAALAVLLGIVGYFLWPPSSGYLYRKAEAMMASTEPGEWKLAEENYLNELDRRFPAHPYKQQTEKWRDQIAANRVERRTVYLDKPSLGLVAKPKNLAEELYVSVSKENAKDAEMNRDLDAAARWDVMAKTLASDKNPENRGWILLAQKRSEELKAKVAERLALVMAGMNEAGQAYDAADYPRAEKISRELLEKYERYPDVKEQTQQIKKNLVILENIKQGQSTTRTSPSPDEPPAPEKTTAQKPPEPPSGPETKKD